MKTKLTILMFFVICSSVKGQVTIQWSDVPSQLGTVYEQRAFKDGTVAVDLGSAGANQMWDFSNVDLPFVENWEVIANEDAALNTEFPDGNLVYKVTVSGSNEVRYNYLNLSETALTEIGQVRIVDNVTERFARPVAVQPKATFPVNYGQDTWTTYNQFIVDDTFQGLPVAGAIANDSSRYEIDGWGVVKTVLGDIPCLRVKQYHTLDVVIANILKFRIENDIIYSWVAPQFGFVLTVKSQFEEADDNFTTAREISMITSFTPTSVASPAGETIILNYSLLDNYPNPFNPVTRIGFDVPEKAFVKLAVFNSLGQDVATLMNQWKNPGRHYIDWNAAGHPSGLYFYQIHLNDIVLQKRCILSK